MTEKKKWAKAAYSEKETKDSSSENGAGTSKSAPSSKGMIKKMYGSKEKENG